ncbi:MULTISPECIES: nuclear transport factor 2 family protein [unclassified Streptomyces]|uniref:nuclear transport factor 2 family protein n=1 Tax=unclassified Streptomyces TaxID=2593676 RepID=UPI00225A1A99|nr:nuclear transport factor 2 family protein [Streptomyces sp. NBC_01446]MCX4641745.1 nuclear transport factor 2 family protein [Streptomyces sp. NBC_01446]
MTLTDAQLVELWDKQALHDNLMLYVRGADRHDRDLILSAYWPDSWDNHGAYVGDGPGWADAALAWEDQILSCSHHVTNVLSEIEGNRAKRESMFICVVPFKETGMTMYQAGRYRDLCEKRDGEWKILHRTCVWDWIDVRETNTDWGTVNVPRVSHWGAWREDDPIYKDWIKSAPTEFAQ